MTLLSVLTVIFLFITLPLSAVYVTTHTKNRYEILSLGPGERQSMVMRYARSLGVPIRIVDVKQQKTVMKEIPVPQPVINVNIDTDALFLRMEPYLKMNRTTVQEIHTQNQTIEKFLMVLIAQNGQKEPVKNTVNESTFLTPVRKPGKRHKAVKQKPTKEQILQFYSDNSEESLRKAGEHFHVSHQTIKNILEGGK